MPPAYEKVAEKIDQIEAEMKRAKMWQAAPLTPEQMNFKAAFGSDTMVLEQWLQFIFVPNVRKIIAEKGRFPASSSVSTVATREWEMWGVRPEAKDLIQLLREFDAMF